MNRRTLLTTLLSGLSAGVAAIAGRKKSHVEEIIDAAGVDLSGINSGKFSNFRHAPELSIGQITEVSVTSDGVGYTFIPKDIVLGSLILKDTGARSFWDGERWRNFEYDDTIKGLREMTDA